MGRVSKRVLSKDFVKEIEEQLSFLISSLTDKDEINLFMSEFLSKEEKLMLGKRLILYMMLYKGMTDSQIHSALAMSRETIHWYRQTYENKSELFRKNIKKLIARERNKELWEKIDKILEPLYLAMEAKTNMRARARLAQGDFWNK